MDIRVFCKNKYGLIGYYIIFWLKYDFHSKSWWLIREIDGIVKEIK